ncbi:MAG TPA: ATP-binding cassette domain-containing protein [Solirubrobacteraceae bacterium]|jgi:ABC-type lipoprotein export system ATPase subunit/predicted RNase H-like HicB family nuclease|nr:ATP-binding cassette domain-containing protein [Solirubrobacteraceae bacterium]
MIAKRHVIVVEGDDSTNYSAYSPDVPGVVATGATREECERELRDAIKFHLEGLSDDEQSGTTEPEAALLALQDVGQRYIHGRLEVTVFERVSFEIATGTFVGIHGIQGSGKSTLLRLMAGIESPSAGTIRFEGCDLATMSAVDRSRFLRSRVALMAPQDWSPGPRETVLDHLALSSASLGLNLREARRRAEHVLDKVGVADQARMVATSLQIPDRTRVMLAQALVRGPSLLLIDEPAMTGGLSGRDALLALLRALSREQGLTVVLASRELVAMMGADTLMSVVNREVVETTPRAEVVQFPKRTAAEGKGPRR